MSWFSPLVTELEATIEKRRKPKDLGTQELLAGSDVMALRYFSKHWWHSLTRRAELVVRNGHSLQSQRLMKALLSASSSSMQSTRLRGSFCSFGPIVHLHGRSDEEQARSGAGITLLRPNLCDSIPPPLAPHAKKRKVQCFSSPLMGEVG